MRPGVFGILLAAMSAVARSQDPVPTPAPTPTPGPLQFQEVVTVEGATKDQLYNAALAWFPSAFKSGKDVLQIQNKEAGMLVGTAVHPCVYNRHILFSVFPHEGAIRYHITVEVKDGRYRVTIDDFVHEALGGRNNISFGLLTTAPKPAPGVGENWRPSMNQVFEAWAQFKAEGETTAKGLLASLRVKMAVAATEKPW